MRLTLLWTLAAACVGGCGDDQGAGQAASGSRDAVSRTDAAGGSEPDAEVSGGDTRSSGGDAARDASPGADALAGCESDEACGEGSFCEDFMCHAAAAPLTATDDGVFRAGVARFDVSPVFFEPWADQAGPECPGNRTGAYDGPLLLPDEPLPPCVDTFDDVDGDGHFDAVWMAGAGADRPASGVDEDNPPAGRVLFTQHNDEIWLLVTLDLYSIGPEPLLALTRGLELRLGIPEGRISVHATGVRTAPDAVGMWGPTLGLAEGALAELDAHADSIPLLGHVPIETGLDRGWWTEVRRRVTVAAQQALANVEPVTLRFARVPLPADPVPTPQAPPVWSATAAEVAAHLAQPSWLSHDSRFPVQQDLDVRVAAFETADGAPLVVLGIWGAGPATGTDTRLSADVAGLVRTALEAGFPGALALWLTGASSEEVVAGAGARVPETDADGLLSGEVAAEPGPALARLLAGAASRALADVRPEAASLAVTARYAWLPITNPRYDLAARLGVVPGLSDWVAGRRTTPQWSSGATTPACGGLGCLRYRLDLVELGPVRLVTTPGGLDEGFVRGRDEGTLVLTDPDSKNLTDLDLDGIVDADDPEIVLASRDSVLADPIRVDAPLNPQRFAAITGLETETTWLIGRTNGGLGSLRATTDVVNVHEGQMRSLEALLAENPALGALDLCLAGYDCDQPLALAELLPQVAVDLAAVLADLPGGHLLSLAEDIGETAIQSPVFRIETAVGGVLVEGQGLVLGPGAWAFALSTDFGLAGLSAGDVLVLADETRLPIDHVVPLELARHPNAGDQWRGLHARGGDAVYNTACELIFGGSCPSPRPIPANDDPNSTLPRQPEASPAGAAHTARRGP